MGLRNVYSVSKTRYLTREGNEFESKVGKGTVVMRCMDRCPGKVRPKIVRASTCAIQCAMDAVAQLTRTDSRAFRTPLSKKETYARDCTILLECTVRSTPNARSDEWHAMHQTRALSARSMLYSRLMDRAIVSTI
jgi:hypothetical protein